MANIIQNKRTLSIFLNEDQSHLKEIISSKPNSTFTAFQESINNENIPPIHSCSKTIEIDCDDYETTKSAAATSSGSESPSLHELMLSKGFRCTKSPENLLGTGAFAQVWKGQATDGKTIALKETKHHVIDRFPRLKEPLMFHDSSGEHLAMNTTGERVQKLVHTFFEKDGVYCDTPSPGSRLSATISPFYEGITLEKYLTQNLRTELDVATIALEIAKAILELQKDGIIHRDLHPGNIIILKDHEVKIIDFTLAKKMLATSPPRTHKLIGNKKIIAPERFDATLVKEPAKEDVFSFGSILWSLASWKGKDVFFDKDFDPVNTELMYPNFKSLIELTTQKDPVKRISIEEVIHHLENIKSKIY